MKSRKLLSFVLAAVMIVSLLSFSTVVANAMTLYVKINIGGGTTITLDAESGDSIDNIKQKIQEKKGLSLKRQILKYGEQELENGRTLADYNIQKESTIQLYLKEKNNELGKEALLGYDSANGYKYIYYGTYGGEPIKWRILSMNGNGGTYKDGSGNTVASQDAMFLLSEYALKEMKFYDNDTEPNENQEEVCNWRYSNGWHWCNDEKNDESFISSSVTNAEKAYLLKTSKGNTNTPPYTNELKDDRFFFLSYDETKEAYIKNNLDAKLLNENGDSARYWLCSCGSVHSVLVVISGVVNVRPGNMGNVYARPAFNLNSSKILFTSSASGKKTNNVGKLSLNADYSGKEYKLTMKEGDRNFVLTDKSAKTLNKGGELSLEYSGAKTDENEYISAMIVKNGEVLYYGQLKNISNSANKSGAFDLEIPQDIDYGTYEVRIFNEQINGDYKTDFSSDFQTFELNVEKETPLEKTKTTARLKRNRALSAATVTMGEFSGINGETLGGELVWKEPSKTISDNSTEIMIFKPDDENYKEIEIFVDVRTYSSSSSTTSSLSESARVEVMFEANGGSQTASQNVIVGSTAKKPTDPKKDGYIFGGWYKDSALTEEYDFSEKVTRRTKLYAKWVEEEKEDEKEPTVPEWKNPFKDVKKSDWFFECVKYVSENGLMNGEAEDEFEPNENITRGMFVTVLYRAEGSPAVNKSIPFADVKADKYYASAVSWAVQNGIINGVSESEFAPDENITREQIAAIVYRYAKFKGIAPTGAWAIKLNYADASEISDYAIEGVMYCTMKNIMQGRDDNMFAPKDNTTRAEAAAILERFTKGI